MGAIELMCVAGARPNFMKVAPLLRAFAETPRIHATLVHTGQHYDPNLSQVFFSDLGIPPPDIHLEVGSGSHAVQTARIMQAFEPVLEAKKPDFVIVVGDVNSTVACSLVAAKLCYRVAHVEAGLRSHDRTMPEEINRLLTDQLSDLLFVSEESGLANLEREGVPARAVHLVGNVMIDTLTRFLTPARARKTPARLGLSPKGFCLATLHRPANVDGREGLLRVLALLEAAGQRLPVVFPVHPRTRARLEEHGLWERLAGARGVRLCEPLGYLDFLSLMDAAAAVVTDSGGVQEETTYLGVPCLTLRPNTERPVTVELGTNELVPLDPVLVGERLERILRGQGKRGSVPPLWDGRAAERIRDVFLKIF